MKFLEYSNKNLCNIIPQDEFEELIHDVFEIISSNISKSLGPLGSSATILDGMNTEATKDGYSILSKYRFHNRYKKMIYNLIKAPCTRMNNTVGDGTTTAIVLSNALFNRYKERSGALYTLYRLPRQFTQMWDTVIDDIIKRVKESAVVVNPNDYDTIYNIAYVTSNGNHEISNAIARTYEESKSPSIKMKDSPTNKSYIQPINGFDFPANLISDAFVRNEDLTATEKDIRVMIFDHKIETDFFKEVIIPINEVFRAQNKRLLILAPAYDAYMCETIVNQYITAEFRNGFINLILAQYETGKLEKYQLNDLATILRTKIITQDLALGFIEDVMKNPDVFVENAMDIETYEFYRIIGQATEAMLSCKTGSIFKVEDIDKDQIYRDAVKRAEKDLADIMSQTDYERQSYASKIYNAKARLSQLEMQNFIYYIGADSALQKQIIWDSVEDVIKCVRSAIKSGIVPGCQLTIMRVCATAMAEIVKMSFPEGQIPDRIDIASASDEDKLKFEIYSMIYSAAIDVYLQVLHGADGRGMIKLVPRWQYPTNEEGQKEIEKEAMTKAERIVKESMEKNIAFNLETLEFSDKIVTSAETDTMVLSAASELVKILISGNQCIFLDSDVNESHNEIVEAYV